MALATKCPHCNTVFRVAHDQLKLRGGIVRCGACNEVFDGNAALLEPPSPAPVPTPLPEFTPLDQKMAALDTHAAEVLSAEPPVMLELAIEPAADAGAATDIDIDIDAQAEAEPVLDIPPEPAPAAQPGLDDEPSATPPAPPPFALPAEPAVLPSTEAPLELDLNVESMSDDELEAALQAELAAMEKTLAEAEPEAKYIDNGRREPTFGEPAHTDEAQPASEHSYSAADAELAPGAEHVYAAEPEHAAEPMAAADDGHHAPHSDADADATSAPAAIDFTPFAAPEPQTPAATPAPASISTLRDDELEDADEEALVQLSSAGMAEAQAARAHAYLHAASADEQQAPAEEEKADDEDGEEPGFVKRARRKQKFGKAATIAMGLGSVLLLGALFAQAVTTFRNPLAAAMPALKPVLTSACLSLGCKIELPTQIDDLTIEQGELQTLSETAFSFVTLLRNQSATAQAWPSIELVLDDDKDKHVLRRVFAPHDYLSPDIAIDKGFAPHTEQTVKLYFELHDLKASGYHIAVFYP